MSQRMQKSFGPELWAQGTRGSESGLLGKAYIENMHTYSSGLLGVRPKWKARWTHTGSTVYTRWGSFTGYPGGTGQLGRGLIIAHGTGGLQTWGISKVSYWADATDTPGTAGNSIDRMTETEWLVGDRVYEFVPVTTTFPGVGSVVPASAAVDLVTAYGYYAISSLNGLVWQGRAWYWCRYTMSATDESTIPRRMHYSDEYDWTTFTDAGYFDLDDGPIWGAAVVGTDMLVWTYSGRFYRFVSSGGGVAAISVQEITPGRRQYLDNMYYTAKVDGITFFLSQPGPVVTVTAVTQDGADDKSLSHLVADDNNDRPTTIPLPAAGSSVSNWVMLPYRQQTSVATITGPVKGFFYYNGAWWNEEVMDFDVDASDSVLWFGSKIDDDECLLMVHNWATGGSPANYQYVYARDVSLNRPSRTSDALSTDDEEMYVDNVLTDVGGKGSVFLPRLQGESTQQYVRVDKISIDAEYWKNSTSYADVAITVSVVDQEGNTNSFATDLVHADLATGEPGYVRITAYTPGLPFTPWSEVRLTGIDAMAIEFVHVDFSVEDRAW